MLLPGKAVPAHPEQAVGRLVGPQIRQSAAMVRMATGLLSIRNSSCSSASRRAAASLSTRRRFSSSRAPAARHFEGEQAGAGQRGEHQDVLRQRNRDT